MASARKILFQVLRGTSDRNIAFRDLRQLLLSLGFEERTSSGHHMFRRAGVRELINIQKEGARPNRIRSDRFDVSFLSTGLQVTSMDKYEVIIYWSKDDGASIAEVPELPGCMAHGRTHEAALKNVRSAVKLWIRTATEFGELIPKPKAHRLVFA